MKIVKEPGGERVRDEKKQNQTHRLFVFVGLAGERSRLLQLRLFHGACLSASPCLCLSITVYPDTATFCL